MRTAARLGLLLLAALSSPGCDTDQPLQINEQSLDLFIDMTGAQARRVAVWDMFQDSNDDNVPDDINGDGVISLNFCDGNDDCFLWCVLQSTFGSTSSVPWNFGIQVSVIRAGESQPTALTSSLALTDHSRNRGRYDASTPTTGGLPESPFVTPPVINDAGTLRRFKFRNPRILTVANQSVITAAINPLHQLRPTLYDGVCPGAGFGPATPAIIDLEPQPFSLTLNKGDTLLVQAIKSQSPPPGLDVTEPNISALVFLDGQPVSFPAGSNVTSPTQISFSFTSR